MSTKPTPTTLPAEALEILAENKELSPSLVAEVRAGFDSFFAEIEPLVERAAEIEVSDASDLEAMAAARSTRLELRSIRTSMEKERKRLKAGSIAYGRAVDGIANVGKFLIEPAEARLLEQEQFVERQEAARLEALKAERLEAIKPYEAQVDTATLMFLPALTADQWEMVLAGAKKANEDFEEGQRLLREKREAQAKAAIEAEKKRRAEQEAERERIRRENEEMRAEREKARAAEAKAREEAQKARAEKEEAEAKVREAELAKIKAEREAEAKAKAAEAAKIKAEQEAARKAEEEAERAANAPDKQALLEVVERLRNVPIRLMKGKKNNAFARGIAAELTKLAKTVEDYAAKLK